MKQFSLAGLISLAGAIAACAATAPIYVNDTIIQPPTPPPQVDATAFLNNNLFNVSGTQLPYQTANTRHFTNSNAGQMIGAPGFNFQYLTTTGALNYAAFNFVNNGRISVAPGTSGSNFQSSLFIYSSNVFNSQNLAGEASSDIRIIGTNVTLSGSGIRAAQSGAPVFAGQVDPGGVTGLYWGAGKNNALGTNPPVVIGGPGFFDGNFNLPSPSSPVHQVLQPAAIGVFTNLVTVPALAIGSTFGVFVHTNRTGPTSSVVQIVFVATNSPFNSNLNVNVRFSPSVVAGVQGSNAIVEYSSISYDTVEEQSTTNFLYLVDASVNVTNITLTPTNTNPRIPNTYTVTRFTPAAWLTSEPANLAFANTLLFSPQHRTNQVNINYAAYSAQIGQTNALAAAFGNRNPGLSDPTNFHGKVEIFSDQLNLFDTRIKAENFIGIQTRNLRDNLFAHVDAPFLNFDVGSTNVNLVISNLAPASVSRLFGTISAWTGVWNNLVTNATVPGNLENIRYHVLIVDNALQGQQNVTLHKFAAHCTNLTIIDNLRIDGLMLLDARAVSIQPAGGLTLPAGSSWAATNVVKLKYFTNGGYLNIPQAAYFGIDSNSLPSAYSNFVNHGSITSSVFKAYSRTFENSGLGTFFTPGSIAAPGGSIYVDTISGLLSNGLLASSSGTLTLNASNLAVRGTTLQSGTTSNSAGLFIRAATLISVTNSLTDGAPGATNKWTSTFGIQMLRRPTTGSLTNTFFTSIADPHAQPYHTWPATNRGANPIGFSNNLALGKLILDGATTATFNFVGLTASNAIYVDYLELRNGATNYNTALSIVGDFVIYFADCNIPPDKLDGAKNGHMRWVKNFMGTFSSTNIVYPSGKTNTFNAGLVRSNDIDSDGDGTVNSLDPTPIYTEESIGLVIGSTNVPPIKAVVSWNALFSSTNILEYVTNVSATNWMVLTNFVTGPVNVAARVVDGVPGRYYRVRVLMP